jgi:uncharacterized radical SAM superfamily Fe-S cluster-containing enzyme
MKDFRHWGIKKRIFPDNNYHAVWNNLKTIRLGSGHATELPPEFSEFYDVGINTSCNAMCDFCYVSANKNGINYPDICETWKKWMKMYRTEIKNGITYTDSCLQIALGSTGEPTIHPQFCEFLKTVYESGVVPNYTTNGITISKEDELSEKILEATRNFVGGVAVSMGNKSLYKQAKKQFNFLLTRVIQMSISIILFQIRSL